HGRDPAGERSEVRAAVHHADAGSGVARRGGSPHFGTLPGWVAALGPNAKMYAAGFSLGSGAGGINSGVISAMTYGTQTYTFGGFSSSAAAAPGEIVEYKLRVANAVGADPAPGVVVADTLPADLTYVAGSLVDNGNGCGFAGKV